MKKPTLVVLAAGMGSRYGGLKQMEGVDKQGHILVDYSIFDAITAGFGRVVFVIRENMTQSLLETIKSRRWCDEIEVEFAFQEPYMIPKGVKLPVKRTKPWGTAHAIACLCGKIDSSFAVINADDFYGRSAFCEIYRFLCDNDKTGSYAAVGYRLKNTLSKNGPVSRGVMRNVGEYLVDITETAGILEEHGKIISERGYLPPGSLVSMNLWGLTAEIVDECERRFSLFLDKKIHENPENCEFYLPSVVSELIKEKKASVKLISTDEKWYGITYKKDKSEVALALEKMVDNGIYPTFL